MTRDIDSPEYRDSNVGEGMIPPRSATPKPRAGEHSMDPMLNDLMLIKAERDLLREREKALIEALGWAMKRINCSELGHGWSAASMKYDEVISLLEKARNGR